MMIKYRVTNVAKDFEVTGKRIVAILEEKMGKQVKSQTALEEEDLDVIFEQLTQETELPNFDAYIAMQAEQPAAKEEPAPVAEAPTAEAPAAPAVSLDVAADDTRRRGAYPAGQVELLNRYFMIRTARENKEKGCIYCGRNNCRHFRITSEFTM